MILNPPYYKTKLSKKIIVPFNLTIKSNRKGAVLTKGTILKWIVFNNIISFRMEVQVKMEGTSPQGKSKSL